MREMKESKIAWVGAMPSDWGVKRGKYTLQLLNRPLRDTDEVITCFRDGEVTLRKNRREDGFTFSEKEIGYQGIEEGDLVIHGMDGFAGSIGISDSRGKSSPVLVVCDSDEKKKYIMYYLRTMAYNNVFTSLATGIRVRSCDLRWNKIAELPFILPPKEEQEQIVKCIDESTATIDKLVNNLHQQVEKLKAYKQSVITEVVTKGLDPSVPMKDSGVEWMGDIPAHWEIVRIKQLGSARNGLTYSPEDLCDEDEGVLVLRSSNIQDGRLCLEDNVYVSCAIKDDLMVRTGDILICSRNGSRKLIGKNAIIDNVTASFGAFMMIFRSKHNTNYIKYILDSAVFSYYLGTFLTATINQLTGANFGSMAIPFTWDETEQDRIVQYLNSKCSKIEQLIALKQKKIDKLIEYKKSLIYEYVTGKKEVS